MRTTVSDPEKTLSTVFKVAEKSKLQCLLIGGQACVIYGGKISSIDIDITILCSEENVENLKQALAELRAKPYRASPPLSAEVLKRGHSLHFMCPMDGASTRLDVLGKMPRVEDFPALWGRRFTYHTKQGVDVFVLSLEDLVQTKKTGRDKDFLDLNALLKAHHANHLLKPSKENIEFWLRESRDAGMLLMLAKKHKQEAKKLSSVRKAIKYALSGKSDELKRELFEEGLQIEKAHKAFREPLNKEAKRLVREERSR